MDLIKVAEEAFATGKQFPAFKAGDTITVAYKIVEGSKERIQLYRGVVIKISGHGDKKRFTVRKMSGTVGVERIFPIESPNIDSIEVNKVGKVRRAKLYYLRKLTGKAARIREKRVVNTTLNNGITKGKTQEIKRDIPHAGSVSLFFAQFCAHVLSRITFINNDIRHPTYLYN